MRHLVFTLLLFSYCHIKAQQLPVRGIVVLQNSKLETGTRKYIADAEVRDIFNRANVTRTKSKGNFTLIYIGVSEGETVNFTVKKNEYFVVDQDKLKAVLGQKATVEISMAIGSQLADVQSKLFCQRENKCSERSGTAIEGKKT